MCDLVQSLPTDLMGGPMCNAARKGLLKHHPFNHVLNTRLGKIPLSNTNGLCDGQTFAETPEEKKTTTNAACTKHRKFQGWKSLFRNIF